MVDSIIPDVPAGDFSAEYWIDRIAVLRGAEPEFRKTAGELNLRLLSSARWPELRLQRKRGWSTAELRLTLLPNDSPSQESNHRWSIILVRYPRFAWLPVGSSNVETIALLSDGELCTGGSLEDCVRNAVRRVVGS